MAVTIQESWARIFGDNVIQRSQQEGSRLRSTAGQIKEGRGERFSFDRIAKTAAIKRVSRLAPTPSIDAGHDKRWATPTPYDWASQLDTADVQKSLIDYKSPYARAGTNAIGRAIDDVIITALLGNATTGIDADGTAALPAGQKVAVAGAGLTLAKLLAGIEILNNNEVSDNDRVFLYSAKNQTEALQISQLTSMDFAVHQAIRDGQPASLLGMKWIRTERLTLAAGDRQAIIYSGDALGLAIAQDIQTRVTERDDLNFAPQVWLSSTFGAVRIEDEAVVEIAMNE